MMLMFGINLLFLILTASFHINEFTSKKCFLKRLKPLNCDNNEDDDEYQRSNRNRRGAPAKTGSHTYTSWTPVDFDREVSDDAVDDSNGKDEDNTWANSIIDVDTDINERSSSLPFTVESQGSNKIPPQSQPTGSIQRQQRQPQQGGDWFTDIGNKIFDSFFFYGIDSGLPEENEKRGGFNKARIDKKLKRKSPFFTSGEILAEDLINSNPSSSSSNNNRNRNDANYYFDIGNEDDQRNFEKYQNSKRSVSINTNTMTIQQLYEAKNTLENELEILQVSIEAADVMDTDTETLRSWEKEKEIIEAKIDETQIKIVNLSLP